MSAPKECVPKAGLLFQEPGLHPILCKPKLLPLKSVTLEKLERMQRDAQEKVWQNDAATMAASDQPTTDSDGVGPKTTDIWRPEDDDVASDI